MLLLLLSSLTLAAQAQIIDRVLARVGDDVITRYDVEAFNPPLVKKIYAIKDTEQRKERLEEYNQKTLDYLVDQYVMLNAAKKEGVTVDESETENAIKSVLETNEINEQQLTELLEKENRTLGQYKWQIKMDILKSRIRSKVLAPKVVVTEDEINRYIKEHKDELALTEQYELRLLKLGSRDAVEKALEFYKEKGSFLETVAKFAGDDNGGYLGWFEYSALDYSLKALLNGKVKGDVTDIYSGSGDYRVLYVENYRAALDGTDEIRKDVLTKLSDEKIKAVYDNWLKESKQKVLVQYSSHM
jgi:peptidyl-prolyl cis-trans isomerase SurA